MITMFRCQSMSVVDEGDSDALNDSEKLRIVLGITFLSTT
jgi:hypothetical protein